MSGIERGNLVQTAFDQVDETGALGVCFTCDGPHTHLTMMNELGACLQPDKMQPFFHPLSENGTRRHVLLDMAHMIKLVRNCLGKQKTILSSSGKVEWEYIVKLYQLQEKEGLRAGTKLRRQHILWEKSKMKVCLATQTISRSVADAIDFCREDLQLKEFEGSEATTEFLRIFDSLFDTMNSRNPFAKGFKAPLSKNNFQEWSSLYSSSITYIRSLQLKDGTPILSSRLKTGFLGFLCAIYRNEQVFTQNYVMNTNIC